MEAWSRPTAQCIWPGAPIDTHTPAHEELPPGTTYTPRTHLHVLVPLHTPQSSSTPVLQHRPEGGKGLLQHTP